MKHFDISEALLMFLWKQIEILSSSEFVSSSDNIKHKTLPPNLLIKPPSFTGTKVVELVVCLCEHKQMAK